MILYGFKLIYFWILKTLNSKICTSVDKIVYLLALIPACHDILIIICNQSLHFEQIRSRIKYRITSKNTEFMKVALCIGFLENISTVKCLKVELFKDRALIAANHSKMNKNIICEYLQNQLELEELCSIVPN